MTPLEEEWQYQQRYYERQFGMPDRSAKTRAQALAYMNIPASTAPQPPLEVPDGQSIVSINDMAIPTPYYLGMRSGGQLDLPPDRQRFNISTRLEGRKAFTRDDIRPNLPPF